MSDPSVGDPVTGLEDEEQSDEVETDSDPGLAVESEVMWTSDDALDFAEARRLTSRRGATVVMFAGDTDVGKTTAMVEIWTSLLSEGGLGDCAIAGANNPLAFERRSFESRAESGMNSTRRTDEDTEGFLHLSVRHERGRQELLFGDHTGEHFRSIREGAEVAEELPWIGRVDRLAVFVDGGLAAAPSDAEIAYQHTKRLLLKFGDCGGLNQRLRAALVLTKTDRIGAEQMSALDTKLGSLHDLARDLDPDAPLIKIAARPATGAEPVGLDALLDWICEEDKPNPLRKPVLERPERAFGRFT